MSKKSSDDKTSNENSTKIPMLEPYQRFTVDQASHSECLPRQSLLGQSRVQVLQEANAGFGEDVVAGGGTSSVGVAVCSTIATGAHLVVWKSGINGRLIRYQLESITKTC